MDTGAGNTLRVLAKQPMRGLSVLTDGGGQVQGVAVSPVLQVLLAVVPVAMSKQAEPARTQATVAEGSEGAPLPLGALPGPVEDAAAAAPEVL